MKEIERVNNRLVLGDGEVTGHQHVIEDPGVFLFQISPDVMQLKIPASGTTLRHMKGSVPAEHRDIQLPAGTPCIVHKRMYQPNGWTSVRD